MSALSQRAVRVIVGTSASAKVIEGLRVQFKVKKTTTKEPNCAEVSISNLSETSRASLQSKGVRVILEAGYVGNLAQIFSGDARYISHVREGADWVTKVDLGDGERAYRWARVSESFKAGTTVAAVVSKVAGALGLDTSAAVALVREKVREQFTQGFTAHGRASDELDRLLTGRGLEWSIQDGRLQVTEVGKPAPGTAILLSASTGLIGSPAYGSPEKKDGENPSTAKKKHVLKVKSLLQPGIRPGARVQLDSLSVKGLFRVEAVTHTGDTHGGDWQSEADLVPASA
jgi:hypothetical protein